MALNLNKLTYYILETVTENRVIDDDLAIDIRQVYQSILFKEHYGLGMS